MSNACTFKKTAMHICGSYQFNLGKYQGDLCDVHYWQTEAEQLRTIAKEQHEALKAAYETLCASTPIRRGVSAASYCRTAIAKYEAMQNE